MNVEQRTEIAYLEDVTEAEVEAVRCECAAEIAERKALYEGN